MRVDGTVATGGSKLGATRNGMEVERLLGGWKDWHGRDVKRGRNLIAVLKHATGGGGGSRPGHVGAKQGSSIESLKLQTGTEPLTEAR